MVSWADKVQEGIELYKCGLTLPAKQVLLSELQKMVPKRPRFVIIWARSIRLYLDRILLFLLSARFGDRIRLIFKPGRGRQVDAGRGAIQSRRDI